MGGAEGEGAGGVKANLKEKFSRQNQKVTAEISGIFSKSIKKK